MDIKAGELVHYITIQSKSIIEDENGIESEQWTDYKKLWAKVSPLSARDLVASQAAQAQTIARMKIRYRDDITTEMRVIHRNRIYAIDSPALADDQSGLVYCTFMLSNGVEKYSDD